MKKKGEDYIIWIGSVFNDFTVENTIALSPAGNKWQLRFIRALKQVNNGINIHCFGHRLERAFPNGKLFVGVEANVTPADISQKLSWYLNIPYVRNVFINSILLFKLIKLSLTNGNPILIITYNLYSYNFILPLYCKYILKIKWISIVADPLNDNTDKYNPLMNLSNGAVFLSNFLYEKSDLRNKINIEGGVVKISDTKHQTPKEYRYILYTGKISYHNGIELLINAFNQINDTDLYLIITGKGESKYLLEAVKINERIIYKGTVAENELLRLYENADILISPRLISDKTNSAIFPSKILEYLSYNKPIISTYTPGINDEYKEVLKFVYSDSVEELARAIEEVLAWDSQQLNAYRRKLDEFVNTKKTWDKVAKRFMQWANELKY
jgi:glycosyltransferase involved in cell wall biosynthesis